MAETNLGRIVGSRIYTGTKPSTALDGDIYIDTDGVMSVYNGSAWSEYLTLKSNTRYIHFIQMYSAADTSTAWALVEMDTDTKLTQNEVKSYIDDNTPIPAFGFCSNGIGGLIAAASIEASGSSYIVRDVDNDTHAYTSWCDAYVFVL